MTITIADSIAIRVLKNGSILTGVGNELHWYNRIPGEFSEEKQVLNVKLKGKVHGIEEGKGFNGSLLLIYGEKEFILLKQLEKDFKEILRAHLSDWISAGCFLNEKEGSFVLLTAHSVLLKYCFHQGNLIKEEVASCVDKSTLYCGSIYGEKWNHLVIFGGNAFGELLIWKPSERVDSEAKIPLLHRISAHNGVIFSIAYEESSNLLTTTSDDRSIRLWNVNVKDGNWKEARLEPLKSGYGHIARVFQGKIIKDDETNFIVTIGEDSYMCIWRQDGTLLFKRRQQFGAIIWNFDYDHRTKTLLTIGSTGNLIAYNLKSILKERLEHSSRCLPSLDENNKSKYVGKIKFLQSSLLIGVTNTNQLVYMDLEKEEKWILLKDFVNFKCTILEVYENLFVLCGYKKTILYKFQSLEKGDYNFELLFDKEITNGIIRAFQFLNSTTFLISDEAGNCELLKLLGKDLTVHPIDLPQCKERWLTAALLLEDIYLLASNRLGNIMLYVYDLPSAKFILKDILKHPHGHLGATSITKLETDDKKIYIKTAGHDGSLKILSIDKEEKTLRISTRQHIPVSWVEALLHSEEIPEELLLGFNDNHFVVWTKEKDFLIQIPCGGGHRCWHFHLERQQMEEIYLNLVFIRNKQVHFQKLQLLNKNQDEIKLPAPNKWHVKPCNIASLMVTPKNIYLVSAGEDNLVKVSIPDFENFRLLQICEIHMHISNIRALDLCQKNDHEYLIFSGGGRAQLCLNQFNLQTNKIEELFNFMLTNRELHNDTFNFDPETRLMSLAVLKLNENDYNIFLACSDGFLRKLKWSSAKDPVLEKELFYGRCLLQVRLIAGKFLLMASTDGFLNFYNLDLEESFPKISHHQSGINSLDISLDHENKALHIITGGDDQAISYSKLNLETFQILKSWHLPYLHTAQVTAASFSKDQNGKLNIFTSGVDQNVYKLSPDDGEVIASYHSCVADVKGLLLDNQENCYLYGCGLQIFQISSSNKQ